MCHRGTANTENCNQRICIRVLFRQLIKVYPMKTYCSALLLCVLSVLCTPAAHAQFQENVRRSLFSDQKAFGVGDAVTILIVESTEADNQATTSDSRSTSMGAGVEVNTGGETIDPSVSISSSNEFRGRGQTTRQERLRSKLSARVIAVEKNGNMRIEGKRTTTINGETQTITITGVVRPADIQSDNSVLSYHISDMTLVYEGEGTITTAQEPGLITKFLRMLF